MANICALSLYSSGSQFTIDSHLLVLCSASSWDLGAMDPYLPGYATACALPYSVCYMLSHIMPDGWEKPIAYSSRSLATTEKNYCHLDKEVLTVIFGINRFHQYIFGSTFQLVSDHKPLMSNFCYDKNLRRHTHPDPQISQKKNHLPTTIKDSNCSRSVGWTNVRLARAHYKRQCGTRTPRPPATAQITPMASPLLYDVIMRYHNK